MAHRSIPFGCGLKYEVRAAQRKLVASPMSSKKVGLELTLRQHPQHLPIGSDLVVPRLFGAGLG